MAAADRHGAQKRDRKREVPLDCGGSSTRRFGDPMARGPAPLDKLASEEESALIDEAVRELSEEYRELILWRDYANAPWDVVARETKRPSAAAARMMHARAMIELAKLARERGLR